MCRGMNMAEHVRNGGYGKPPLHSRFKKGESGNPSGRPKAVPSFKSDLLRELQIPHDVQEEGHVTTVTKQRALVKSLTAAALNNDMRALNMLLALIRHYGLGVDEPAPDDADIEDLDALQTYIDNQRQRQSPNQHPTANIKPSSDE
jgi:Family of unknown function (DUF5681)